MASAFTDLGLSAELLGAIADAGYEAPTAIQASTIPALLAGRDLIGQAQTGTGKTAAFALPILQQLDLAHAAVQALVLAPTRELAIQVAEAIHTYSKRMGHVRALPVYGGSPMSQQIRRLKSGVHVVVGTPGRIMDHLRRGTLRFDALRTVILDEADEMLRMGFIDDVEWILGQMPAARQMALFSATMPPQIKRIAERYLRNPQRIEVERTALTLPAIEQRYLNVTERQKLDALTRVLEVEPSEATLVFVRPKTSAADVAERLQARGYAAEAMHGDMAQAQREQTIRRLRAGQVEIVVATDVAARGLDVEHITHVINYDVPHDSESYVHRIGRTGRAGRAGTAIMFVTPRETRLLKLIERFTGQRIAPMRMPSVADVAARRASLFKDKLRAAAQEDGLEPYLTLVEELAEEGLDLAEVAAGAAKLARGSQPLEVAAQPEPSPGPFRNDGGMARLFIDAGREAGVRPADIVGAIAGETGISGQAIGAIDLYDRFAFVEVPSESVDQVLAGMRHVKIRNRPVQVKVATPREDGPGRPQRRGAAKRRAPKPRRVA